MAASVAVSVSTASSGPWAVPVFFIGTVVAIVSLLKVIDAATSRSWEYLRQVYQ